MVLITRDRDGFLDQDSVDRQQSTDSYVGIFNWNLSVINWGSIIVKNMDSSNPIKVRLRTFNFINGILFTQEDEQVLLGGANGTGDWKNYTITEKKTARLTIDIMSNNAGNPADWRLEWRG